MYLVDILSFAQKVRKLLVAMKLFPLVLKTLQKIMKLLFKLGMWKVSIKSRKFPSTHMI